MSKILANQIANYGDDSPIEIKEGLNIPAGKPLQAAGSAGTSGQVLGTTGATVQWITPFDGDYNSLSNRPSIPAAQVNSDWDATSGVSRILNKPTVPPLPTVTVTAAGASTLSYNSSNGEFTYTPPDLSPYLTSYTETSTLDQVLARGSSSSRSIQTGAILATEITLRNDGTNNGSLRIFDTGSYTRLQFRNTSGGDGGLIDGYDNNINVVAGTAANSYVSIGDGSELKCYRNPSKVELNANTYLNANFFAGSNYSTYYGASNNLRIWSNGTDSYIQEGGSGSLWIESNGTGMFHRFGTEYAMVAIANAQVDLFYDGGLRFRTTTAGSETQGTHNATGGYTVSGSALDLTHLDTVDLSTAPTDGQVLKWEASSSSWKPANDLVGGAQGIALSDLSVSVAAVGSANLSYNNTNGVFTYTPPDLSSYLTAETDPVFSASAAAGITSTQVSNWDVAYGWGNHAAAGYLSSLGSITTHTDVDVSNPSTGQLLRYNAATTNWENFTPAAESDTLQSVTDRGSIATNSIQTTGLLVDGANNTIECAQGNITAGRTFQGFFTGTILSKDGNLTIVNRSVGGNLIDITQTSGATKTFVVDTNANLTLSGSLTAGGLTYPTTNGTNGQVLTSDGTGNVVWQTPSGGGGGGGASVTISDTPPAASAGDLWWESDTGRLKIYYQDTDSTQWVDTSPPLADPSSLTNGATSLVLANVGGTSTDAALSFRSNSTARWKITGAGHLIPETNDVYDIGSAEYKVRDLYLGSNSLWIGDDVKMGLDEEGKIDFRKRKKRAGHVPRVIVDAAIAAEVAGSLGEVATAALAWMNTILFPNAVDLADPRIKIELWYKYGVENIPGFAAEFPDPSALFPPPDAPNFDDGDYEEIIKIGQEGFRKAPIITNGTTLPVSLKAGFPHYVFIDPTGDFTIDVNEALFEEGAAFSILAYIRMNTGARRCVNIRIRDFAGNWVNQQQLRPDPSVQANQIEGSFYNTLRVDAVFLQGGWRTRLHWN